MTHARRSFPPAPSHPSALVLKSHPYRDSFNDALADAWTEAARSAGLPVRVIDITALDFDPVLRVAHRADQPLEPDLQAVEQALAEAAHLVVAFPVWWGSTPAVLKGLFDRVLRTGWAYTYEGGWPVGGLAGRSGRVLVTMDAPVWYDRLWNGRSAVHQVRTATLAFCGIQPVGLSAFGSIRDTTADQRARMLEAARAAGRADAARVRARHPTRGQALPPARSAHSAASSAKITSSTHSP